MKRFLVIVAFAIALANSSSAAETNVEPRFAVAVTCFNGKVDSKSFCSATATPEAKHEGKVEVDHGLTCGLPGKVSEIHWRFVGHQGPSDVYLVSRRFPADKPGTVPVTNSVIYFGKRVSVFLDSDQVIVMEPPKKE